MKGVKNCVTDIAHRIAARDVAVGAAIGTFGDMIVGIFFILLLWSGGLFDLSTVISDYN
jgi:hypothetical protein